MTYRRISTAPSLALLTLLLTAPAASAQPPVPSPAEAAVTAETAPPTQTDFQEAIQEMMQPGGLTASEASEQAVATSPTVEAATFSVRVAEAGARQAWYGVLPIVEAQGRYTRVSEFQNNSLGGGLTDQDLQDLQMTVGTLTDPAAQQLWTSLLPTLGGFSFPILRNQWSFIGRVGYPVSDLFSTILPMYRAALSMTEVSEAQVQVEEYTVAWRARQTYFEYVRARASRVVAEKSVEQMQVSRDQVEALVDAGASARVDLMRMDARLADAMVGLARAEMGLRISEQALATLLHLPLGQQFAIGEDFSSEPPTIAGSEAELLERAYAHRPEMESLRRLEVARGRMVRAAQGGQYPDFVVMFSGEMANPNQFAIPQADEWRGNWDLTALLSWSLNQTLDASARTHAERAELEQVRADILALQDGLRMEVSRAYHSLAAADAALVAARLGLVAADESYRVRFEQLQAGAAVTRDLIDAETDLTAARLALIDAAVGLRLAHAGLLYAVGDI